MAEEFKQGSNQEGSMRLVAGVSLGIFIVAVMGVELQAASIQDYCKSLSGDSYSLLESCIKSEETAKQNIQSRSVDSKIKTYCEKLLGDSYSLLESCIKSEEEAKKRLGM